jgi:uncharacterized repeat protein (TIGR03803 family)
MGIAKSVARATVRAGVAAAPLLAALLLPVAAHAWTLKTLHTFVGGSDGEFPTGALLKVGRFLYGTTPQGGASNAGTVFKIDSTTGAETVVYSFLGGIDGSSPAGDLINVGGTLFGTTSGGGTWAQGTVFKIDPVTGAETVLHSFDGDAGDGVFPFAGLINVGGLLYGTTSGGGLVCNQVTTCGTVFRIDPSTRAETILHDFNGSDGEYPTVVLHHVGRYLYGTTNPGGALDLGTLFRVDPISGAETVVHSFGGGGSDGEQPGAAVINIGGSLYGTTVFGGTSSLGTVFKRDLATGAETVVYSFSGGVDGQSPEAALLNVGGQLYGTTVGGGSLRGEGTVFQIDPSTGAETVLHTFTVSDGAMPHGALINVGGVLYGTTSDGGAGPDGLGTVFSLTP